MAEHKHGMLPLLNRLRYRKDDPLRYHNVPKNQRQDDDPPREDPDETIDLQWYRDHPDG